MSNLTEAIWQEANWRLYREECGNFSFTRAEWVEYWAQYP